VNPTHRLWDLNIAAQKRIARLRSRVSHLNLPSTADKDIIVAWTVIESTNLWGSFLRAYYLSGAIRTRTMSGGKVTFTSAVFADVQSALMFAVRKMKNKNFKKTTISRIDEPSWNNSRSVYSLLSGVGISNITQVNGALSYSTRFFQFLPTIRNFYAHRCDETFRRAALVGVRLGLAATPRMRATEMLSSRLPTRPQNLITDWLDDMANVIDMLCS
jgi:hypothetical protein